MDHHKAQESLLALDAPRFSAEERREVLAHLQVCEDCRRLRNRWERIHGMLANASTVTAPQGFTDRVMEHLVRLEVCAKEPVAVFRPWSQWLYPTLGYVFALSLMFTAVVHWEPFLNTKPSTENVLLSDIPQSEQLFFAQESPEVNHLFVTR